MTPFIIIPQSVLSDTRLSLRQFRVLCALFSHRDPKSTNVVFPSRERLAELTGYTVTRISATTRELDSLGWIVKVGNGGRGKNTRYQLQEMVPESGTDTQTVPDLALNGTRIGLQTVPESGTHNGIDHRIDHNIPCVSEKRDKRVFEIPPKQEDAEAYGVKIGLPKEEVLAFMDHHAMNGWIMKTGKKMVDWEAGLRTWARSPYRKQPQLPLRNPSTPVGKLHRSEDSMFN